MIAAHLTPRRWGLVMGGLALSGFAVILLGISIGPTPAPLGPAWQWLFDKAGEDGLVGLLGAIFME